MSAEENKATIRRLADALNSGRLDAIDDVLAEDYVRHDPGVLLGEAGRQQYKRAFAKLRRAFPDAHWGIEELLSDEDRVIARWTFRGTHNGPFFSVAPTGRSVTYPIIAIYRIADGRIAEDWHIFGELSLWQQLIPEISELLANARE